MNDYRFSIDENTGTITRARAYRLPSEWTSDEWGHYFGEDTVAFYDEGYRGLRAYEGEWGTDTEGCDRAMVAYSTEQDNLPRSEGAMKRLAVRLTGQTDQRDPAADFIRVGLDRGVDFYVLTYNGDPDRSFAREIEAVNEGDIWRIECEEFLPYIGEHGAWLSSDDYPEQFYGEDKALTEFARVFGLTEFPAETLVTAGD